MLPLHEVSTTIVHGDWFFGTPVTLTEYSHAPIVIIIIIGVHVQLYGTCKLAYKFLHMKTSVV